MEGDIVLVNYQPSLQRMSMMAHEVKVSPFNTITLNPVVFPFYHVENDRDGINIHMIQSEEARAEAKTLMEVQDNIFSPRFGGPIVGGIQEHISGTYLLTREGSKFKEDEVFQMLKKSQILTQT